MTRNFIQQPDNIIIMTSNSSVNMTKTYTITITKEDGGFVGTYDELRAVSEGGTFGETIQNVREAVSLAAESGNFNMLITEQ